jgi:hypothetical protein
MEDNEVVLLTPEELQKLCRMSKKFISKHIFSRRLPGMVKCGGRWRFNKSAVMQRLNAGSLLLPAK